MIKILIADDSAVVRSMLKSLFADDSRFTIAASVENGQRAVEVNRKEKPDLIIMDVNMPILNGIEATKRILRESSPAVVFFTTEDSVEESFKGGLGAGAVEIIKKPDLAVMTRDSLEGFVENIYLIGEKHRQDSLAEPEAQEASVRAEQMPAADEMKKQYSLVVMGASTGGPAALQTIVSALGKDFPLPVLITQHIDEHFDSHFASWLNDESDLPVQIAKTNTEIQRGNIYIAPAGFHLTVIPGKSEGRKIRMLLTTEPPVHFLRPAVDKLFTSAASVLGSRVISVLLTGMGKDGCDGSREIMEKGGLTIAQDEKSCVVYGMPRAAVEKGYIRHVLSLNKIAPFLRNVTGV